MLPCLQDRMFAQVREGERLHRDDQEGDEYVFDEFHVIVGKLIEKMKEGDDDLTHIDWRKKSMTESSDVKTTLQPPPDEFMPLKVFVESRCSSGLVGHVHKQGVDSLLHAR